MELLLIIAPQQYDVQIEPVTVRGALGEQMVEQMLRSARAQQIHEAIINNRPLRISVGDAPDAGPYPMPWYYREEFEEVTFNEFWISEAARDHGIDPDMIRAIIWLESTHGWYDEVIDVEKRKTLKPMNVYVSYWKGLGYAPEDLRQRDRNIMVGTRILKELWQRVENPSVEKVATLYHNLGEDKVSAYGRTAGYYYRTKPWKEYLEKKRRQ